MKKVLIIDDSLTIRMNLKEIFEESGFTAFLSSNADSSRKLLLKEDIDLIVLDMILPDMDGISYLKELRQDTKTKKTPVIMISSIADISDNLKKEDVTIEGYFQKPYEKDAFIKKAKELTNKIEGTSEKKTSKLNNQKILVVDDSLTFQHYIKEILENQGYSIIRAFSAEEGLKKALQFRPDVIIIDDMLPGIDGTSFIRKLRTDSVMSHTPCLLLTASEEASGEVKAFQAGANDFIKKSEDSSVILLRLEALLRAHSKISSDTHSTTESLLEEKKILIIDDNMTYLQEISKLLNANGYITFLATSGKKAFEVLTSHLPDCILLDLNLPETNGEEICKQIKNNSKWNTIPILIITGSDDLSTMKKSFDAGADDFIPKSSEIEVIIVRIEAQFKKKQFEQESLLLREQLYKREIEAKEAQTNRELAEIRSKLIEDLKQKNNELKITNQELEDFTYLVTHDLQTPLKGILGYLKIILEDYSTLLDKEIIDYLNRIINSAEHMNNLIKGLLQISKITRKEIKQDTVNLSTICKDILDEIEKSDKKRKVNISIEKNMDVKGDALLLRSMLENLISNAWKFTAKNKVAKIEIGATRENQKIIYYIKDNGAGFSMEHSNKLFKIFERFHSETDFPGTGIGLASVHKVIKRHGGRIWAKSEINNGTTFFFTLNEYDESQ